MNILIRNTSSTPIYEQIVSQIKAMIISGALQEGDALPSMRLLAKELRISVITTKRAYEEAHLQAIVELAVRCGLSLEELQSMLALFYGEKD